jgi:hypothetical protein
MGFAPVAWDDHLRLNALLELLRKSDIINE